MGYQGNYSVEGEDPMVGSIYNPDYVDPLQNIEPTYDASGNSNVIQMYTQSEDEIRRIKEETERQKQLENDKRIEKARLRAIEQSRQQEEARQRMLSMVSPEELKQIQIENGTIKRPETKEEIAMKQKISRIRDVAKTDPALANLYIQQEASSNPLQEAFIRSEQSKNPNNIVADTNKVKEMMALWQQAEDNGLTGSNNPYNNVLTNQNASTPNVSNNETLLALNKIRDKWGNNTTAAKEEKLAWLKENKPEEYAKIAKPSIVNQDTLTGNAINWIGNQAYKAVMPMNAIPANAISDYITNKTRNTEPKQTYTLNDYVKSLTTGSRKASNDSKKQTKKQLDFIRKAYPTYGEKKIKQFEATPEKRKQMIADITIKEIEKINRMDIPPKNKDIRKKKLMLQIKQLESDSARYTQQLLDEAKREQKKKENLDKKIVANTFKKRDEARKLKAQKAKEKRDLANKKNYYNATH